MAIQNTGVNQSTRTVDYQIWHILKSMETVSVGIVHKFNPVTRRADIRLKPKVWHEAAEHEQDIKRNVPVVVLGGGPWDVEPPIHDEFNPYKGRPDIVLLVYSKYPLEQLLDDYKPKIAIPGHSATFSEDNLIAMPLRFWTKADGAVKRHHTWKEVQPKPSTRKMHHLRIFHQDEHQEIVLHNEKDDKKPKWITIQTPTRIDLIEDAQFNAAKGPRILGKYNSHGHPLQMPGGGGPPPPSPKWGWTSELSQSVFVDDGKEAPSAPQNTSESTGPDAEPNEEKKDDFFDMLKDFFCNEENQPESEEDVKNMVSDAINNSDAIPDVVKGGVEQFIGETADQMVDMAVDVAVDFGKDLISSFVPIDEIGGLLDAGAALLNGDPGAALGSLVDTAIGGALKSVGLGFLEDAAKGIAGGLLAAGKDMLMGAGCGE